MADPFEKKQPLPSVTQFPPVPRWKPAIVQPMEQIVDRVLYYTNHKRDFVLFEHGTCVIVRNGLPENDAIGEAKDILAKIYNYHPDMNPRVMDDGNILIQYNHPAMNVVLGDVVKDHWEEIELNHQDALAAYEVFFTRLGPNKFDDFGKKALWGRCFMFMDAQFPRAIRVVRASV